MTQTRIEILKALDHKGGLTTPRIGAGVTYSKFNKRAQSAALRYELLRMEAEGLVRKLDELKPVCWCITPAGKALISPTPLSQKRP